MEFTAPVVKKNKNESVNEVIDGQKLVNNFADSNIFKARIAFLCLHKCNIFIFRRVEDVILG